MAEIADLRDRKSYEQVCPMSVALDLVGDRWTILILRELLGGPARFQEIRNGLPGIAPNLLAERLRRMEEDDIVRRVPSGGTVLYAVTDSGEAIRTAIEELGMWGARMGRVGPATHQRSIRAVAVALQSILVRARGALPEEACVIELDVDGEHLEVVLGQRPRVVARPATAPSARMRIPSSGIAALLAGMGADGNVTHVDGDAGAAGAFVYALGGER